MPPNAEQIAVERVFDGAAVDQEADVDDVAADGVWSGDRLERIGQLHKLHLVAFGVLDGKPEAAVRALVHLTWHLP